MKRKRMRAWLFMFYLPFLLSAEMMWKADLNEPFALLIKIHSDKIALDEAIRLEAEFHYPDGYALNDEELLDHLMWTANPLAPRMILQQSDLTTLPSKEGIQNKKLQVILRPLASGPLYLSFLDVELSAQDKSKAPVKIGTPIFTIQVTEALPQEELSYAPLIPLTPEFPMGLTEANRQFLFEDPKRIEAEKKIIQSVLERHAFPWLAIALLLGFGAIGWMAYLTRDRWPKLREKPVIKLSPKEQADQALKELNAQNLIEKRLFQKDYTELSSILLNALQGILGWNTKEMTTEELKRAFKKDLLLSKEQKQEILLILLELDQVKFAKREPSIAEAKEMHERIWKLVDQMDSNGRNENVKRV